MDKDYFKLCLENKFLDINRLFEKDTGKREKVYSIIPSYPNYITMRDLLNKSSKDDFGVTAEEIIKCTSYLLHFGVITLSSIKEKNMNGEVNYIPFYQRIKNT
jgi:hypothetical protein